MDKHFPTRHYDSNLDTGCFDLTYEGLLLKNSAAFISSLTGRDELPTCEAALWTGNPDEYEYK